MPPRAKQTTPRVLVLAGGKGGVGTSLLAANLGILLARQGRETVLVDASAGGASLHLHLGVPYPSRYLDAGDERPDLEEVAVAGGIPHLRLVAGIAAGGAAPRPGPALTTAALAATAGLTADFVVVDAGSGRFPAILEACRAAHRLVLVATPDFAALAGALRLQAAGLDAVLAEAAGRSVGRLRPVFTAAGLRGVLEQTGEDRKLRERVINALRKRRFGLIVNQCRTASEMEAVTRAGAVLSMLQAVAVDPVQSLEYDLSVQQAVSERRVLAQRYPNAPVVRGLEKLVWGLVNEPEERSSRLGEDRYAPLAAWNHYRLLALDPRSSPREVQRHYEWIKSPFSPGGEAEAVASRPVLDQVLTRVETAYRTLVFLENRREYDRELVETGALTPEDLRVPGDDEEAVDGKGRPGAGAAPDGPQAAAPPPGATGPRESRPRPERPPGPRPGSSAPAPKPSGRPVTEGRPPASKSGQPEHPRRHTGEALRELRQRRNMDVERIAAITKIRVRQIEAMENQRYEELPVPVFLRGFLRAYARCLDLDDEAVVRDYMEDYTAWREARP